MASMKWVSFLFFSFRWCHPVYCYHLAERVYYTLRAYNAALQCRHFKSNITVHGLWTRQTKYPLILHTCIIINHLYFMLRDPMGQLNGNEINLLVFNPLNPKIKIEILICCPYSFHIEAVGRSWQNIKQIHLVWSCSLFSWPLCFTKHW